MSKPLVSVIIPCYNTEKYVGETLDSVLNQTYENWEAIIVNDGSPDNVDIIIKKWLDKDVRFKYFEKENGGLASARNYGIERANGKYIFPLDSDNYIANNYLELAIPILEQDTTIEVLYATAMKFDFESGIFELQPYSFKYLMLKNCIDAGAFFRKSSFDKVGGYCEELRALEDWDLWISLLKNGGKVHKIEQALFYYRIRESGSLINELKNDRTKFDDYYDVIFKRHTDEFLEHIGNPFIIKREQLNLLKYKERVQSNSFYRLIQSIKRIFK